MGDLTSYLVSLEERPWSEFKNGGPITKAQLSRELRRYGIVSGTIRLEGGMFAKGCYLDAFADAFQRYTPQNRPLENATPSHS